MDKLTAALRMSKVIALHQQRKRIDIDCFYAALQFITPGETDSAAGRAGVPAPALARAQAAAGGQLLLDSYQAEPALRLVDALVQLKTRLAGGSWAGEDAVFVAPPLEAAGLDAAIAAAVQAVAVKPPPLNPVSNLSGAATTEKSLRERLDEQLLGQELAATLLREELTLREWKLDGQNGPQVFLLLGPPSSGKTLMTSLLAQHYSGRPMLTLNMASYQSEREGFGLTGLRYGWSDARPGRLTGFVWEHPRAIVVFEHIDRAHENVQQLLMPLLAGGSLDDEYGFGSGAESGHPDSRSVDFSDTILLFTSNAASAVYEQPGYQQLLADTPEQAIAQLRAAFGAPPASQAGTRGEQAPARASGFATHLSQFPILPFLPLGLDALLAITGQRLATLATGLQAQSVACSGLDAPELAWVLTLALGPDINARELDGVARPLVQHYVRDCDASGASRATQLVVSVAPSPLLERLRASNPAEVLNQLLRRSETLRYRLTATRDGATLTLQLDALELERVRVQSDYGNTGGFVTELPKQGFDAIFGHQHVKQRLQQVLRLLQQPASVGGAPLALPKGMLLYGSAGTGKTMLAKALAAEARLPFISVTGPQLLDLDLIRTLFQRARKFAPSIVFIDEIDALGVRGAHGADVCINQLLTEIDGFSDTRWGGVFVIAATNFPGKVDPALTRSGRLDLNIEIPMLDREARALFVARLHGLPHQDAWDDQVLLDLSAGMTGADLEKVYRECALDLVRRQTDHITQADVLEQINVIRHGQRVENPRLREQLESTAFHEAGHAVVSMVLNPGVRVQQITIVPRRDSLGFTSYDQENSSGGNFNRAQAINRICVALAGRIAESRRFPAIDDAGGNDAGAASDLHYATLLAWQAITEWGLDEEFGWLALSGISEAGQRALQERAVERSHAWLAEARQHTTRVIDEHWRTIERVANYLLEHEMLDGDTLRNMLA